MAPEEKPAAKTAAKKSRPSPAKATSPKPSAPEGERIAKVLSRAGIASRREAERLIELGEVAVNGKVITSPALNVTAKDKITVQGKPVAEPEPARMWLYYKPEGLVTSEADEKGRATVFDHLPEDMPRVMSVGRLDLNSEGLLLLTNDGEIKRRLELPSTGWLRKYRVRVNGNPMDPDLDPLRKGIVVEGEKFQPMIVSLDRIQGANAWLTVGLREGRNREIRRAMSAIGLQVNRLIRTSYGPFSLGELEPGQVQEVKARVLRDQLGLTGEESDLPEAPKTAPKRGLKPREPKGFAPRMARIATPQAQEDGQSRPQTVPDKAWTRSDDTRPQGPKSFAKPGAKPGAKPFGAAKADPSAKPGAKPAAQPWSKPAGAEGGFKGKGVKSNGVKASFSKPREEERPSAPRPKKARPAPTRNAPPKAR